MLCYNDCIYHYSNSVLRVIEEFYGGEEMLFSFKGRDRLVTNPLSIAEYHADFDTALRAIGVKQLPRSGLTFNQISRMRQYLNQEQDEFRN